MNKACGKLGEDHVSHYLVKHGFSILEKNYKKFFGEIDIIAQKQNLYAFVEVKTRRSKLIPLTGLISPSKQKKIIKTAETFISEQKLSHAIFRFDVALVHLDKGDYKLEYIENAFIKNEEGQHGSTNFY